MEACPTKIGGTMSHYKMVRINPQDWKVSDLIILQNWFDERKQKLTAGK